jgi:hypothetical protein
MRPTNHETPTSPIDNPTALKQGPEIFLADPGKGHGFPFGEIMDFTQGGCTGDIPSYRIAGIDSSNSQIWSAR